MSTRECPHGIQVGPLDDYGVSDTVEVAPYSAYCLVCNSGRTRFICPFCKEAIVETLALGSLEATEAALRAHIVERHPIRWRMHRKMRRAVRSSGNNNERETG